jgi:hypothetical protein
MAMDCETLLSCILSGNNAIRREAEAYYTGMLSQSPADVCLTLLDFIATHRANASHLGLR